MSTTASITLEAFQTSVLPLLQSKHKGGSALAEAIKAFAQDTPILDEHDQEIDVDTLVLAAPAPSESVDDATKVTEAHIRQLVAQTLGKTTSAKDRQVAVTGGDPRIDSKATHGFARLGDFALAVHKASAPGGVADPRLLTKAPSTYAHEGAGGTGGYLVPQEWADRLWEIVLGDESILSRTNRIPTSRNALSLPVSETTAWGTTGVQAYWMDEAEQITQSRPKFEYRNLRLHKLAALVPASDELLEDATALDAFVGNEAGRAIRYKADDAIVNGDGVGKPLGILNAAALVAVAKESGQGADTVVANNVARMYARMPAPYVSKAVWLINQDVLPQLLSMTLGDHPIYLPPNGITDAPFGTLLGRPVLLSQHSQTLGDAGDILFADLSQYLTLTKADGLQASSSVHLWFDYDVTAFRFTFRLAGQPWLSAAITPDNSTATLSPFVTLAERA